MEHKVQVERDVEPNIEVDDVLDVEVNDYGQEEVNVKFTKGELFSLEKHNDDSSVRITNFKDKVNERDDDDDFEMNVDTSVIESGLFGNEDGSLVKEH